MCLQSTKSILNNDRKMYLSHFSKADIFSVCFKKFENICNSNSNETLLFSYF